MSDNTTTSMVYPASNTGSDVLTKMARSGKLSQEASEFVRLATDPYHDYVIHPAGVPDTLLTQSVTKCVQTKMTLTAPDGLVSGDTWHALIHTNPWDCMATGSDACPLAESPQWYDARGQITINPTHFPGRETGLLQANVAQNTLDVFPTSSTYAPQYVRALSTRGKVEGRRRIIGCGFEVTNATPELYKGGTVTVGRRNVFTPQAQYVAITNAATDYTIGYIYEGMAKSESELFDIPGSKTWNASEGVYSVVPPDTSGYELRSRDYTTAYRIMTSEGVAEATGVAVPAYGPNAASSSLDRKQIGPSGLSQTLAYFSGLSYETVLVVTLRTYVEYLPHISSPEIAHLRPAPDACLEALELVNHIHSSMPPGVPVGDNAGGDWFRWVSKALTLAIPVVFPQSKPVVAASAPLIATITDKVAAKLDVRAENRASQKAQKKKKKKAPK